MVEEKNLYIETTNKLNELIGLVKCIVPEHMPRVMEYVSKLSSVISNCTLIDYEKPKLYYIQDARTVVGNCMYWWRPNGRGYTTDIKQAGKFDESYIKNLRDTDIAFTCEYIDSMTVEHVRADQIDKSQAIKI